MTIDGDDAAEVSTRGWSRHGLGAMVVLEGEGTVYVRNRSDVPWHLGFEPEGMYHPLPPGTTREVPYTGRRISVTVEDRHVQLWAEDGGFWPD